MSSTKYLISFWVTKTEEPAFAAAVRKYNSRQTFAHTYQVAVAGTTEIPADNRPYSQAYVEVELSCTDVVALFKFGEFWGNKQQLKYIRDPAEQKGGPAGG